MEARHIPSRGLLVVKLQSSGTDGPTPCSDTLHTRPRSPQPLLFSHILSPSAYIFSYHASVAIYVVLCPLFPSSPSVSLRDLSRALLAPSLKDFASDLPAEKWDAEKWTRGKRARRDSSSPLSTTRGPCLFGSSPIFREQWAFVPPPSQLPSTSDAFQLFPSRPQQSLNTSRPSSPMLRSVSDPPVFALQPQADDITRLRSFAFGELQRSVEESGEGLVNRMRDWEQQHAHTHPPFSTHPSLAPAFEVATTPGMFPDRVNPSDDHFDDEDDIQIVSGDLLADGQCESCSVDADSENEMDLDLVDNNSCRWPADSPPSERSGYISDEDLPALSLSSTDSPSSSQISFPVYHESFLADSSPPSHRALVPTSSCGASPSEKAVAALTLVMASGAGGLNDYEAVRALDGEQSSLDESSIGEMWH
ncbi:hypothetical protein PHLGIDRAFT_10037 [Phlebiopsis gigantea 11061_1 CR5-6]|uniref:Uncharacterized protein n=1 Tax=Phlebiopsis gigantea (strain 11061_1 CR5-6) TaxID=745531 RepID=A0A0C3P3S9_PHLG1|nr:hypothetical protein PHLGIDRAFT_10037 [Phlebiopsis gigantea 11061_1 CR5-6]